MFSLSVHEGDILQRACDLLVLKHADGFYGVDELVADRIGFDTSVKDGSVSVVSGSSKHGSTLAKQIAFIGVGSLENFSYAKIRRFGRRAIEIASRREISAGRICLTAHGTGIGLDEVEAFSSLVAGIYEARAKSNSVKVEIIEHRPERARRFKKILGKLVRGQDGPKSRAINEVSLPPPLQSAGVNSDQKTKLFVAMPFKEEFNDEWEISIQEAANSLGMLCERIDKSAFVGDISSEIKRRIEQYDGLVALLNGANPNVFLEIGYAWAKGKPTLLLAKQGQELPFDVKGQRCLFYTSIADLRKKISAELSQLQSNGVFANRKKL